MLINRESSGQELEVGSGKRKRKENKVQSSA